MPRLRDLMPSKNFEDRTGLRQDAPWHQARTGNIPHEFLAIQNKWIADAGRQITEDENAALWEAYTEGRLRNFLRAYRDMGPPQLLTPRR